MRGRSIEGIENVHFEGHVRVSERDDEREMIVVSAMEFDLTIVKTNLFREENEPIYRISKCRSR